MSFLRNKKVIISISISCLIHMFIFILIPSHSFIIPPEAIAVQIDEKPIQQDRNRQQVEQNSFNYKTSVNPRYASAHNNATDEETKNALTGITEQLMQDSNDNYLNSSDFSMMLSKKFPGYKGRIDFLENVKKEGLETQLNTEKLLFNGFYSRVKHQLYWHWLRELETEFVPSILKEKKQVPLFTTYVQAYLNKKGHLIFIKIIKKSGFDILDNIAVTSMQKAHPFNNPPRGLLSKKNSIQLNYSFTLTQQHSRL